MSSIVTHIASCAVRWEETQMRLPHHQRQQPPLPPKYLSQVLSGKISEKELEEFNSCAVQEWNRVTLAECKHCKRTFQPSSLEKHKKSCTKSNPMSRSTKEKNFSARASLEKSFENTFL